ADSTVYVAPVATDGVYALLNLPNGEYEVMAYADANQDWTPGPTEPRSRAIGVTLSDDTLAHDLAILPFDTTAARVQNAAMQNGVIRVQLDDYVDSTGIAAASVTLYTVSDTTPLPATFALRMSPPETARTDTRTDVDSAQAAVQDTLAAVQDTLAAEPDAPAELPGTEAVPATPAVPLPAREFFAIPTSPIAPGEYLLGVRGITNINGYPDGGGLVPLRVTPADTARALPDTIAVPDTSTMRVDTLRTLPDSTRIPPDSTRIPPATAQAPPAPPPPPGSRVHRPWVRISRTRAGRFPRSTGCSPAPRSPHWSQRCRARASSRHCRQCRTTCVAESSPAKGMCPTRRGTRRRWKRSSHGGPHSRCGASSTRQAWCCTRTSGARHSPPRRLTQWSASRRATRTSSTTSPRGAAAPATCTASRCS